MFVVGVSGCDSYAYDVKENLSYDSTIGIYGTLDFYEPESDSVRTNRLAILAIHGGAWKGGDKASGEQFAEALCPFGYVVFSINYRLAGRPGGTWPAQIEDVQKALRYIAGRFLERELRSIVSLIASSPTMAIGSLRPGGDRAPGSMH